MNKDRLKFAQLVKWRRILDGRVIVHSEDEKSFWVPENPDQKFTAEEIRQGLEILGPEFTVMWLPDNGRDVSTVNVQV